MKRRRRPRRRPPWGSLQPPGVAEPDEFGAALANLEGAIAALRQRYDQIRAHQALRTQQSNPNLSATDLADLEAQLRHLEAELESSLLTWDALAEPFWQAVRFGGAGVVLGWLLARIAGG